MPKTAPMNRKDKLIIKISDLMIQAILSNRRGEDLFEEVPEGESQATCNALVYNLEKWEKRRYNFELAQLFLLGQLIDQQSNKDEEKVFGLDNRVIHSARFLFSIFQGEPYAIHYLEGISQRALRELTSEQRFEIRNRISCQTAYNTRQIVAELVGPPTEMPPPDPRIELWTNPDLHPDVVDLFEQDLDPFLEQEHPPLTPSPPSPLVE
jgi:hypothetical protein